jgi:putative transposase
MKFAFIAAEKAFPIDLMCRVLEVSRSGYYAWKKRRPAPRTVESTKLAIEIKVIHDRSRRTYGSPRVHAELRARGQLVGRNRVAKLMRAQGLVAKRRRRFRATTDSKHSMPTAPNTLGRAFKQSAPNAAWVTDITYVPTREGWLYLAVILDLFSRRVVGWAMSDRITRKLTLDALDMALCARRPPRGLLHHSDRGCQYASHDYRRELADRGIDCSMSRKANCWDNAVAESFFATLKTELVHHDDYPSRARARSAIFDYVEVFYNRQRRHSHLGYVSPEEFELRFEEIKRAA